METSLEQIVRLVLSAAIEEKLVLQNPDGKHPLDYSAGALVGVANVLSRLLMKT